MDPYSDRIDKLVQWCDANGLEIDPRLQLVEDDQGSISVLAAADIDAIETVCRIPRASVLSVQSCSASHLLDHHLFGRNAQLNLALGLYIELEKGPSSFWHGYLQSLPTERVDLPVFWLDESLVSSELQEDISLALEWLKGTEVETRLQHEIATEGGNQYSVMDSIRLFYDQQTVPLLTAYSYTPTFEAFCHAFSLVASRAFFVDEHNGLCMVPIADAFNHTIDNHVHLESDFGECPLCSSLGACVHNDLPPENRGPNDEETYDMVMTSSISSGSEIFNTYGEHLSNAELFLQYGFLLDVNENDRIHIVDATIPGLKTLDGEQRKEYAQCRLELGESDMVSTKAIASISPLWIDSEGRISFGLWVALCYGKSTAVATLTSQLVQCEDAVHDDGTKIDGCGILSNLADVTQDIIALCERQQAQRGPGLHEELGDLFDQIPDEMPRSRMASSLMVSEYSVLESCKTSWMELLCLIDGGYTLHTDELG